MQHAETEPPSFPTLTMLAREVATAHPPSFSMLFAPSVNGAPRTFYSAGTDGADYTSQQAVGATASFLAWTGNPVDALYGPTLLSGFTGPLTRTDVTGFNLVVSPGPGSGGATFSMGCATTAIAADALSSATGWVVAAGLGTTMIWHANENGPRGQAPDCATDLSVAVGPGTALTIANLDDTMSAVAGSRARRCSRPRPPRSRDCASRTPGTAARGSFGASKVPRHPARPSSPHRSR